MNDGVVIPEQMHRVEFGKGKEFAKKSFAAYCDDGRIEAFDRIMKRTRIPGESERRSAIEAEIFMNDTNKKNNEQIFSEKDIELVKEAWQPYQLLERWMKGFMFFNRI